MDESGDFAAARATNGRKNPIPAKIGISAEGRKEPGRDILL
jgi:hypothetical protein